MTGPVRVEPERKEEEEFVIGIGQLIRSSVQGEQRGETMSEVG